LFNKRLHHQQTKLASVAGKYTFSMRFDTLPADASSIDIVLSGLIDRKDINKGVELTPGDQNLALNLEGNEIIIKSLQVSGNHVTATILTGNKNPLIEKAYRRLCGGARASIIRLGRRVSPGSFQNAQERREDNGQYYREYDEDFYVQNQSHISQHREFG